MSCILHLQASLSKSEQSDARDDFSSKRKRLRPVSRGLFVLKLCTALDVPEVALSLFVHLESEGGGTDTQKAFLLNTIAQ